MTELELNKEYTYSQICEILGWEQKAGNSKKAQIHEIESAYEYYHSINLDSRSIYNYVWQKVPKFKYSGTFLLILS